MVNSLIRPSARISALGSQWIQWQLLYSSSSNKFRRMKEKFSPPSVERANLAVPGKAPK